MFSLFILKVDFKGLFGFKISINLHSIFVTHYLKSQISYIPPVWHTVFTSHHLNISTFFETHTWALSQILLLAYLRNPFPTPFLSLLISPSPLQESASSNIQTQIHKNRRRSVADLHHHQRRDFLRQSLTALTKCEKTWPISLICRRRSPPTQHDVTSSLFVLSQLVSLSDLCFLHLGFEKTVRF